MVRLTVENKFKAALAGDCVNNSEREIQAFKDWALFDMEFEVRSGAGREAGLRHVGWVETEVANCSREECDGGGVQSADESAATDERNSVTDAFLFGETDDFNSGMGGAMAGLFGEGNAENHAKNAVEGAARPRGAG